MRTYTNSTTINELISNAMDKLKTIVDSSTIVGESIKTEDGVTIVPISKVTVGFVVGGGEYADLSSRRVANHFPMSGGSSGGMSVSPVGFLIIQADGAVDFVNVENKTLYQTIVNLVNSVLRKIDDDQTAQKEEKNEN
ncbi:MAG: sporulation protein YtfJ [Clostridia bacterium]|nr:sporulation protein YtfJ [Clostridia bacterium]